VTLEQRVAEAKERLHRSIGQRARWAQHDIRQKIRQFAMGRQRELVNERLMTHLDFEAWTITGR
jgi:hypothetical protein